MLLCACVVYKKGKKNTYPPLPTPFSFTQKDTTLKPIPGIFYGMESHKLKDTSVILLLSDSAIADFLHGRNIQYGKSYQVPINKIYSTVGFSW